jgi:type I restriction enzyme, R subunit
MNNMTNKDIAIVAQSTESTVVAQFTPSQRRAEHYQSEDALEKELIAQLQSQAYEYLQITQESDLVANLRLQLEKLNHYTFSDSEWKQFFAQEIANPNQNIEEKTTTIQEDYRKILYHEDGTFKTINLLDKSHIHNNSLQVINQYATDEGTRANRYDVTILVNGLPLVHVELKRRGVAIQEAFNQINRYQRESFWSASGLFEYVQLFVISNGTHTKYYSNTTRWSHIKEHTDGWSSKGKKSSNSFEFTSRWADHSNRPIMDLMDFAKTFFAKHALLNILTKYCIFTADRSLLVMRPYQIVATEKIINRIETSTNYKKYGTIEAGGYVWHTTGSGKTLTSFKTAQLASKLPTIKKVLFIVDRKDLDYQTMKEYDKFEKWAANSNTSTAKLQKQLEDPNATIIITTIQKLDKFIKKNKGHTIFEGHIVLIFDECHRSQFGDMHHAITTAFKKYHLFGFTGTPIFAANSSSAGHPELRTTIQAFGCSLHWDPKQCPHSEHQTALHTYTIVDAIADKNVLPFKVDYVSTIKEAENIEDTQVKNIDREKALMAPERISNIVTYIREHFDQKTKRNSFYMLKERRLAWFNSIFAVSSIEMAKIYYTEFQKQLANLPSDQKLKIATIFSYTANEEEVDGTIDENPEDTQNLDASSRDFLEWAIQDYNQMFETSYDTSSDKFQNYYKDVSQRVKNREIDVLIVVNMFLTGFDATTLNTLRIDKNLQSHGLIQAFSRTNRILNSVKTFGNIVCFRNLEKKTNEAIALFGNKQACGIVLLKTFDEYYHGYQDGEKNIRWYQELVDELLEKYPLSERILWEQGQKDFIKLYGGILRVRNILTTFDDFAGKSILTDRDIQDYHSRYIDLYNDFRTWVDAEKENINDDLVFEMELIKQIEINIDYIIELIKRYHQDHGKNKEILIDINKAIDSSVVLRNKKDLIEHFIQSLDMWSSVDGDWIEFVEKKKKQELDRIIKEENLNPDETYSFIANSFRDWSIPNTGTGITKILPQTSRFRPDGNRTQKRETVLEKLMKFFERFFDISPKEW